jgi:hypothetical protein
MEAFAFTGRFLSVNHALLYSSAFHVLPLIVGYAVSFVPAHIPFAATIRGRC